MTNIYTSPVTDCIFEVSHFHLELREKLGVYLFAPVSEVGVTEKFWIFSSTRWEGTMKHINGSLM